MPNFKILGRLEVPFSFIPPRVPEKKGLDRRTDGRTDGQQSDPIRVPFFPFEKAVTPVTRRSNLIRNEPDSLSALVSFGASPSHAYVKGRGGLEFPSRLNIRGGTRRLGPRHSGIRAAARERRGLGAAVCGRCRNMPTPLTPTVFVNTTLNRITLSFIMKPSISLSVQLK
ncbi:hypothetical protein EVAR_96158_1 [Eumeta japonica]|uniref:Uncharacterized protein n=1 Tax=Eumeta variegata TaxID=151549 RepID=A0A4C1VHY9_EUMVA|nr:hypothetical protein EVAR_96158_1 [Eumeta japonica]